ncbi:hypothetical protein SAMN05421644_11219 [Allochromatium warmingii]|uniref:Uncharacterized protein n=1 Tax=Allochromatium warmingii TaxID=61595 RepID=A0A1H3EAR9_ALLWA|nr:hypothetical protein [Allochromatium warmingii]SDX75700.1 hypothetical protein SAMN05421644_11219 [Allochromatium warmingii]
MFVLPNNLSQVSTSAHQRDAQALTLPVDPGRIPELNPEDDPEWLRPTARA